MQVVVAIDLVVLQQLSHADELILAEDASQVQAFLHQFLLLDLVLGENARAARVVRFPEGVGDDLHEEPQEVYLAFLYLADAGDTVYLLEVKNRCDVEVVIFFLDFVHGEVSVCSEQKVLSSRGAGHGKSMDETHTLIHLTHTLLVLFIKVTLADALEIVIDLLLSCLISFLLIILILRTGLINLNNIIIIHRILIRRIAVLPFLVEKLLMWLITDVLIELIGIRHMLLEFRITHVGAVVFGVEGFVALFGKRRRALAVDLGVHGLLLVLLVGCL